MNMVIYLEVEVMVLLLYQHKDLKSREQIYEHESRATPLVYLIVAV